MPLENIENIFWSICTRHDNKGSCILCTPQASTSRVGHWQSTCSLDLYEPIVVRLEDFDSSTVPASKALLKQACEGVPAPLATVTGVNSTLCSAQVSVTENTSKLWLSNLGSTAWYGYVPSVTYTLIGGAQPLVDFNFTGPSTSPVQRFCVFWPTFTATGQPAGGTNKWAKPVIDTITTTSTFTNAPASTDAYMDFTQVYDPIFTTSGPGKSPVYQEAITVTYVKDYLPVGSL